MPAARGRRRLPRQRRASSTRSANGNIQELLDKGLLPTYERFEGEKEDVRSKLGHIKLDHDTVFVALSGGGGGLGDPLLRDPEAVARDVAFEYATPDHASSVYGVIVTDDHQVDEAATTAKREEIRAARIGGTPSAELKAPVEHRRLAHPRRRHLGLRLLLGASSPRAAATGATERSSPKRRSPSATPRWACRCATGSRPRA